MENASYALLIAGGIFFAMLVLCLFVYMFNTIGEMKRAEADVKQIQELAAWNSEWESYNKEYLYGSDVLTVINKAEHNNKEYDNQKKYIVNVTVYKGNNVVDKSYVETTKTSIYKCTKMDMNQETGRINEIEFVFVE